jgi:hypothetical protein
LILSGEQKALGRSGGCSGLADSPPDSCGPLKIMVPLGCVFLQHEHDFLSFSVLGFGRGILEHRIEDLDRLPESSPNFAANFRVPAAVFS